MTLHDFKPNTNIKSAELDDNFEALTTGVDMHYSDAWTEYEPEWTAPGTAISPLISNGYIHGRYFRMGKLVIVRIFFKAGSSTAFGTAQWRFGLPVPAAATDYSGIDATSANYITGSSCGGAYIEDLATIGYAGYCRLCQNNTVAVGVGNMGAVSYANQNDCTASVPFTWASGDFFSALFTYEAEDAVE